MRKVATCGCDSSRLRPGVAPLEIIRNRRIELIEAKGSRELNAFGRNALILQAVAA
jgi:hypothetical protein